MCAVLVEAVLQVSVAVRWMLRLPSWNCATILLHQHLPACLLHQHISCLVHGVGPYLPVLQYAWLAVVETQHAQAVCNGYDEAAEPQQNSCRLDMPFDLRT